MRRIMTMALLAGALGLALPAAAQPDARKRQEVRREVTEFMLTQLQRQLALDAPTMQRVRDIWQRYQAQIDGVHQELGMAMRELKAQLAAPQPDDARLTQLSDLVLSDRLKAQEIDTQRIRELKRALTPAQFAKAIVVTPQIRRQVQQQVVRALRNGQPGEEE